MPVLPSYRNQSNQVPFEAPQRASQLTGFYMRATLTFNGLSDFRYPILFRNIKAFKRSALLRHLSNGVLLKPVEPVIIPFDGEPIPDKIYKPHYVKKGFEKKSAFESFIKPTNTYVQNEDNVKRIRQACRLGRRILNHLAMITKVCILVLPGRMQDFEKEGAVVILVAKQLGGFKGRCKPSKWGLGKSPRSFCYSGLYQYKNSQYLCHNSFRLCLVT